MDKFTKIYLNIINQWQQYIDQNGYAHDDQGNVEYVGRHYSPGTYGLHDRYRGNYSYNYTRRKNSFIPDPNAPKCPKCGAQMKLRTGKFGKFYGCTNYPSCKGTKKYTEPSQTQENIPQEEIN